MDALSADLRYAFRSVRARPGLALVAVLSIGVGIPVFQEFHLLEDLTVYENLEVPLSYRDVARRDREAIVAAALDRFGIVAKKGLLPGQLSGGQRQLVAVARAGDRRAGVVLADEPTGSLHRSQGDRIMDVLGELNRAGTTVVQVTHDEEYAGRGDRVVHLRDGWLADP